jgi:hypothetical protein
VFRHDKAIKLAKPLRYWPMLRQEISAATENPHGYAHCGRQFSFRALRKINFGMDFFKSEAARADTQYAKRTCA